MPRNRLDWAILFATVNLYAVILLTVLRILHMGGVR